MTIYSVSVSILSVSICIYIVYLYCLCLYLYCLYLFRKIYVSISIMYDNMCTYILTWSGGTF